MQCKGIDAVAFDAMGVLYKTGDDVEDLLIPYLRGKGCTLVDSEIEDLYRECSLGKMSSSEFWNSTNAVGATDFEYCQGHRLTDGILPLLVELSRACRIACLSNDVSEWSVHLRERFGLTEYIGEWVISGDIGVRKPDREAFAELCYRLGLPPHRFLLVDDRAANIDAAMRFGLAAIPFRGTSALREELGLRRPR
jgi:putative hydrolase of the HAD superfamily